MIIKQGKDIHPGQLFLFSKKKLPWVGFEPTALRPGQLFLFSKKKLPWVGFEPTTLRVLGERSTN